MQQVHDIILENYWVKQRDSGEVEIRDPSEERVSLVDRKLMAVVFMSTLIDEAETCKQVVKEAVEMVLKSQTIPLDFIAREELQQRTAAVVKSISESTRLSVSEQMRCAPICSHNLSFAVLLRGNDVTLSCWSSFTPQQ